MKLEERLIDFLDTQDYIELLDGNVKVPENTKIADYCFFNRDIIVELKALNIDPKGKILDKYSYLTKEPGFPVKFGEYDFYEAVRKMPNGDSIAFKIFNYATRSIENHLRSADKQISDTKSFLKLNSQTTGILLLVNNDMVSIPTESITQKISYLFSQKNKDNNFRFSQISAVIIIQEFDFYKNIQNLIPCYILENNFANPNKLSIYDSELNLFLKNWALYNGFKFIKKN